MADISSLLSRMPQGGAPPGAGGGMPAPPMGGGMPGAAKPNIGPVTPSQPHAGNAAAAMNDLRNAITMLEKALPSIPMGTPLHTEVLSATQKLAKHLAPGDGASGGLDMNALLQVMRQASQQSPMAALNRMAPPGGAPGGAPAMPMAG